MTANIKAIDACLIRRPFVLKGAANVDTVFAHLIVRLPYMARRVACRA
jgi:hypothetical protein